MRTPTTRRLTLAGLQVPPKCESSGFGEESGPSPPREDGDDNLLYPRRTMVTVRGEADDNRARRIGTGADTILCFAELIGRPFQILVRVSRCFARLRIFRGFVEL